MRTRKGQASFEFLSTYAWILMVIAVTAGALIYFDVFNVDKYLQQECEFGQNILCTEHNVIKSTPLTFEMNLYLRNNLEKSIVPVSATMYDDQFASATCEEYFLYCPNLNPVANWSADLTGIFTPVVGDGGKWTPGRLCRFQATGCELDLNSGSKETLKVSLEFQRFGGSNTHTIIGRVFSAVQ
ncbi:hypothetical protein H8D36_03055 [archaeon]|nr:hypothetical protein [archaeon]MBL7057035.1 hypothetical protein [Candidatus Woesearchaeota archaeon]